MLKLKGKAGKGSPV
jgi:hypothetical protein